MICNYCFENEHIKEYIQDIGDIAEPNYNCTECETTNDGETMYLFSKVDLAYKLQEVIANLYLHENEHGLYGSAYSFAEGDEDPNSYAGCSSLNEVCWELFEDGDRLSKMIVENPYLSDIKDGGSLDFTDEYSEVWKDVCYFEENDYHKFNWEYFSKQIKHSLRFFDLDDFNRKEELEKLDTSFEKFGIYEYQNNLVFRARGADATNAIIIKENPAKELGQAPASLAGHNRFSPSGIPYIYLAFDDKTAINEVFEEGRELYIVGIFELNDDLKLLNLTKENFQRIKEQYLNPFGEIFDSQLYCNAQALEFFIKDIQKPINNDDKILEYIPTQVLAEYIKLKGYDGFVFSSTKHEEGINLVLFKEDYSYKSFEEIRR